MRIVFWMKAFTFLITTSEFQLYTRDSTTTWLKMLHLSSMGFYVVPGDPEAYKEKILNDCEGVRRATSSLRSITLIWENFKTTNCLEFNTLLYYDLSVHYHFSTNSNFPRPHFPQLSSTDPGRNSRWSVLELQDSLRTGTHWEYANLPARRERKMGQL